MALKICHTGRWYIILYNISNLLFDEAWIYDKSNLHDEMGIDFWVLGNCVTQGENPWIRWVLMNLKYVVACLDCFWCLIAPRGMGDGWAQGIACAIWRILYHYFFFPSFSSLGQECVRCMEGPGQSGVGRVFESFLTNFLKRIFNFSVWGMRLASEAFLLSISR